MFTPAATETAPPTRLAATSAVPAAPTARALSTAMAGSMPGRTSAGLGPQVEVQDDVTRIVGSDWMAVAVSASPDTDAVGDDALEVADELVLLHVVPPATVTASFGTVASPASEWASAGLRVRQKKNAPSRLTLSPDPSSVSCLTTVAVSVVSAGLQKSNARRSKVSWRPNRTLRRTGLADSTSVSQSRSALVLGLLGLGLGLRGGSTVGARSVTRWRSARRRSIDLRCNHSAVTRR